MFPMTSIKYLDFTTSDHCQVEINISKSNGSTGRRKQNSFGFEEVWLQYEGFDGIVYEGWNKAPIGGSLSMRNLLTRISQCSNFMERCGRSKKWNYTDRISRAKADYQRAINTNKGVSAAGRKLKSILLEEEIFWKQRARTDWVLWGDKNMTWFYQKATQ